MRLGRWRALGARSKAAHVRALCERDEAAAAHTGRDRLRRRRAAGGAARARAGVRRVRALGARRRAGAARAAGRAADRGLRRRRGPGEDGEYDLAILSHVLEHVPVPGPLLAEAARVAHEVLIEVPLEDNRSAARPAKREEAAAIGHLHFFSRAARGSWCRRWARGAGRAGTDPLPRAHHAFFASGAGARRGLGQVGGAGRAASRGAADGRDAVHRALRGARRP